MSFLLDTNVLAEAKNAYYGMDFCPGYWEWLVQENGAGRLHSIERVRQEFEAFEAEDELKIWAQARGAEFFLPIDEATNEALRRVANHVQGLALPISTTYKNKFLSGADPILIAHALAHGCTVVTREKWGEANTTQVKIPNICRHFSVPVITPFEMMRQSGVRFDLRTMPATP